MVGCKKYHQESVPGSEREKEKKRQKEQKYIGSEEKKQREMRGGG
jgi:hypothetical protein